MATPTIDPSAVVCPGARLIGRVTVGPGCFIGPNAVLRGDIEPIVLEEGCNVQDNCVLHTHAGNLVRIGKGASIGHGAVVHGATIEAEALIGMNAVVLDNAVVGRAAVVGALCLVPERFQVPPASLAVGIPCRIVKEDDERIRIMAVENGRRYHGYREEHKADAYGWVHGPAGAHPA